MELLEEQRETWGTRGGFVLAAVGSAVGLGNLWGFPYKLYKYGGGAFLIPYITAIFCIGVPMLILEFSLGHFTQRAGPGAFGKANKRMEFAGWWGILLGFVIITYYPVILAYCFSFMWFSIKSIATGTPLPWAGEGAAGVQNAKDFFNVTYLAKLEGFGLGQIRWHILSMLILAWVMMYFCIFRGVKLVGKIVWITVPLPFLMLVVLTVRGLTLPGSMKGLVYYLDPVWSELTKPTTWRFAFGQAFFSLSLSFGVMITYASFLHRKSDINNNAAIIGISDFATSFIGGLAIFATLGGMAFATGLTGDPVGVDKVVEAGPGLAFIAFPYALAQLPGAAWWSLVFFFTLVTLGIDSAFSITESVLVAIIDKTGWRRCIVLPVMSLVGLMLGLAYVTRGGLNWLETIDGFINGTWGIAFLGLVECVLIGWLYRVDTLRRHANDRSDWRLGLWWNHTIRIFIPVVLGTLFFWSIFEDITNEEGFFRTPGGEWIVPNCVGMFVVVVMVPVISILMSIMKTAVPDSEAGRQRQLEYPVAGASRAAGIIALFAAIGSGVLAVYMLAADKCAGSLIPLAVPFGLGLVGILVSTWSLEKFDVTGSNPSLLARWGGIISIFDVSGIIAAVLINITARVQLGEAVSRPETLTGVSYVILSVVFLLIAGGLAWCFWRAMAASAKDQPEQRQRAFD